MIPVVALTAIGMMYIILIFWILSGWNQSLKSRPHNVEKKRAISVIIAARNEEEHISHCIQSILNTDYPKDLFEVIVVNDHSEDDTCKIVESFASSKVKLLSCTPSLSGKKAAISYGVSQAKNEIIICTDADCIVNKDWLLDHSASYEGDINFVTGMVLPRIKNNVLTTFQWFDFAATMAITANGYIRKSYFLGNGANLSFRKSVFSEVNGYQGNEGIASGDDLFLIQKMLAAKPGTGRFLHSFTSMVETKAEMSWSAFFQQRKRWATKAKLQNDPMVMYIQTYVFMYCLAIIVCIVIGMASKYFIIAAGIGILIKWCVDFYFLNTLSSHFQQKKVMSYFLPCFIVYFVHILLSGYHALRPSPYIWKRRLTN